MVVKYSWVVKLYRKAGGVGPVLVTRQLHRESRDTLGWCSWSRRDIWMVTGRDRPS